MLPEPFDLCFVVVDEEYDVSVISPCFPRVVGIEFTPQKVEKIDNVKDPVLTNVDRLAMLQQIKGAVVGSYMH